jgi:hypothetical protein
MKTENKPTTSKRLATVDLAELATVLGGRWGVNKPKPTGNSPKRRR